MRHLSFRFN